MIRFMAKIWLSAVLLSSIWAVFSGPTAFDLPRALAEPSASHWMGYDTFGRPIGKMVARSAAISIALSALTALIIVSFSVFFSGLIPLLSTKSRHLANATLDTLLVFPSLLLGLALAAFRGPGFDTLVIALCIGSIPEFTRLLATRSLELANEPFIEAARASGASRLRILRRHLTPHLLGLAWVKLPGLIGGLLIAEATLSFLGIGVPPSSNTWGRLLAQGKDYLLEAPHIAVLAGLPLALTIFSIQVFSESKELG